MSNQEPITAYWFGKADKNGLVFSPNAPRMKWKEGQKRTLKGEIVPCQRGYHASPTLWQALPYAPGPVACLVELSGTIVPHGTPLDKYAASTRKLIKAVNIERELRLFTADSAEHVLYLFEREHPDDDRPRKAIHAARDFAEGRIDAAARAAASAAARAAARAAAWDAARAAASAAAWDAARAAAWDAAWDAARAAASAAAWDAASAAETSWQRQQFEQRFGGIFA